MVLSSCPSPALLPSMSYRIIIIDRATVAAWMDSQKSAVEFNKEVCSAFDDDGADADLSIRSRTTSLVSQS
jgi:hypothetical protein